jgi:hypothetical protein
MAMASTMKRLAALAASAALVISSSAAAAATPTAPAAQAQAPNAWMMLSVLGPTRSIALGGTAAAAPPADVPPAPPPGVATAPGLGVSGEVLPVFLWFGLIAIALTISGSSRPNSPP